MKHREKRKLRLRKSLRGSSNVNLISMMDILTVLLLFLLKSHVAEGEVMVPAPGVKLPTSTAQQAPHASMIVAIDSGSICVDKQPVASVADAMRDDSPEISGLTARLQALRAESGAAGADPLVTIQGDRNMEYRVLRKVMITLGSNGFANVSLAVLRNTQ